MVEAKIISADKNNANGRIFVVPYKYRELCGGPDIALL